MGVLISCIMPTSSRRRAFIPQAIASFQAQTYEPKELVILDDGDGSVRDLVPDDPRVRFFHAKSHIVLGLKRNMAVAYSRGQLICHWDDDDLSAPGRLADQAARLLESKADLAGYRCLYFADERRREAWVFQGIPLRPAGTTMIYTAEFWKRRPFPNRSIGEDGVFSRHAGRVAMADGLGMIVARVHEHNTAQKPFLRPGVRSRSYNSVPWSELPEWYTAQCPLQ